MIQEHEIKAFLTKKRLNPVIFNEIYDHFVLQISKLMLNSNMSFQEAFLKTKVHWQYELEMVKVDIFSFRRISRIEKNVLQARFRNITISSIIFALICLLLFRFLISSEFYIYLQLGLAGVWNCLIFYNFAFKKMKFKEYYDLSFHPLIVRNLILGVALFLVTSYFNQNIYFWQIGINNAFLVFAITVNIQLLYFRSKKVNIFIQYNTRSAFMQ